MALLDATGRLDPAALAWIERTLVRALHALGAQGEVRVRIAGDQEIAFVHEAYLGDGQVTDVITFDLNEGHPGPDRRLDADLLVCLDEAERQSAARGLALERELLLYALHGVLHCLGEDDHDDERSRAMHAREDAILRAIGVGATFGAPRVRDEEGRPESPDE